MGQEAQSALPAACPREIAIDVGEHAEPVADVAEDLGWSVHDVIESLESGDLAEALVDSTLLDGYDDGEEHKVTEL